MKTENKKLIILPFSGFYCSIHGQLIDQAIEQEAEYYNEQHDAQIDSDGIQLDYQELFREYSKDYTSGLDTWLADNVIGLNDGLGLEFESLESPREYNFSTDRIFATISDESIKALSNAVDMVGFAKYVKERFTSYDGFISYYSNDLNGWMQKPCIDWDCNELGALLGYLVQENEREANCMELEVIENANLHETVNNYVYTRELEQ